MTETTKTLTFTEGDVTLTIDIGISGVVEFDITDKYGGPYNEGSSQTFILSPEQGVELEEGLQFGKCDICGLRNDTHKMSCPVSKAHRLTIPMVARVVDDDNREFYQARMPITRANWEESDDDND